MIKYTKAKEQDLKELVEIDKIASEEISWWDALSYNQFLKTFNEDCIYLAKDNNKIIGYLSTKKKKENKEDVIYLENIFVINDYRNKSVSKNLINIFLEEYKSYKIKLHAPRRLEDFYLKCGFTTKYITMEKK